MILWYKQPKLGFLIECYRRMNLAEPIPDLFYFYLQIIFFPLFFPLVLLLSHLSKRGAARVVDPQFSRSCPRPVMCHCLFYVSWTGCNWNVNFSFGGSIKYYSILLYSILFYQPFLTSQMWTPACWLGENSNDYFVLSDCCSVALHCPENTCQSVHTNCCFTVPIMNSVCHRQVSRMLANNK